MKKLISYILLTAMLVLQLSGCGREEDVQGTQGTELSGVSDAESSQGTGQQDAGQQDAGQQEALEIFAGSGGILDPSAVLAYEGKDNSLDVYSAVMRTPLRTEEPENALQGGAEKVFLAASRAYYFRKHLFEPYTDSWDEVSFITAEGETGSTSYAWANQLWDIGPAAGTDHYVVLDSEKQESSGNLRWFFTERDENNEKLREFPLDFLNGSAAEVIGLVADFTVDLSGDAHLVWRGEEGMQYVIISQEGEILAECTLQGNYNRSFVSLNDGRVALLSLLNGSNGGMSLQYMEAETGRLVPLASLDKLEQYTYYVTLFDEDTLLYANKEGIYRSRLTGEEPELLYRWINHGIIAHGVNDMQADEEGRIALIYQSSEDYNYLCLEPTTEEVPLIEITMAVPSNNMDTYEWAVAEFNKRYPSCHIELSEYEYNDTAMLTQLTAGKGPVVIDPRWLGFEDLEALWEPLDAVMEQIGVMGEMYPTALGMGRINGTLYGMVSDFSLNTVIVTDQELKDWDYDTFFQCIQDKPELESLIDYYDRESGPYYLTGFLNHGIDDNYFFVLDEETGTMHFDSDRFRKVLELAEKYCSREEGVLPGSSLLEGKTLCNTVSIYKPQHLAAYRVIYGDDINYIGYPTKEGAALYMESYNMLSIRRSATKEEKEAAAAFIALYLSYEGQSHATKGLNYHLSARRDVLEEQIAGMGTARINMPFFGEVKLSGKLDIELDRKTLQDMIDMARPGKSLPTELQNIISEEMELYYGGTITQDMLIDHLESRVGLYLGEKN